MNLSLVKAIIVLPGTVLVLVPAAILRRTATTSAAATPAQPGEARFWIGLLPAAIGLVLAAWTTRLFLTAGKGTPAPWDPPERLVVRGPYRHVRNPMIAGVLLMLGGEALLFGSWPVAGWMLAFALLQAAYLLLAEEPGLEQRFGEDYRRYKANVPRWIPSVKP